MPVIDDVTGATLVAPKAQLNFLHSGSRLVPSDLTAFEAYLKVTEKQPWLIRQSFVIRDFICRLMDIETIGGFQEPRPAYAPAPGGKLDFFDVVESTEKRLVLAAPDRHLNVYTCFHLSRNADGSQRLTITSSVKTFNLFGRLYMLPVAPGHKLIVRQMLKRFDQD
ncbi:DUF2867 domain-containing protein [Aestuariispira insulae]|uniref:Uncharacterized protein DUF2867 n=1 Tax=Aestuariispira insulae TaxID=1461337 RepID=A0A3D9HRZ1_9PROT|nr:DUF2867 domain-containing protein [Aestuariispira insulae]RED52283.1 uncharacterized protein DUF2867 [Aestuariispira insulae]